MKHAMTFTARGRLFSIERPWIMGILNVTPDSFFQQVASRTHSGIRALAEKMFAEGADVLDIGGQSSRPGAQPVAPDAEWDRVGPVLKALRKDFPDRLLSIDTFYAEVARRAALEGVDIINDISAGTMDPKLVDTVAELQLPYIAMHMQGTPQNMQDNPRYKQVTQDILQYFSRKIAELEAAGIKDIFIDPGFGFGKTAAHNFQLLRELQQLTLTGKPILAGISRKSFIYRSLNTSPENALTGTTFLHAFALQNGASILRVHDVQEAAASIQLFLRYQKAGIS